MNSPGWRSWSASDSETQLGALTSKVSLPVILSKLRGRGIGKIARIGKSPWFPSSLG